VFSQYIIRHVCFDHFDQLMFKLRKLGYFQSWKNVKKHPPQFFWPMAIIFISNRTLVFVHHFYQRYIILISWIKKTLKCFKQFKGTLVIPLMQLIPKIANYLTRLSNEYIGGSGPRTSGQCCHWTAECQPTGQCCVWPGGCSPGTSCQCWLWNAGCEPDVNCCDWKDSKEELLNNEEEQNKIPTTRSLETVRANPVGGLEALHTS